MIPENTLKNLVDEKTYDNVLWEYDDNIIQIIKRKANPTGATYNLKYDDLKNKYDVMIVTKENYFQGYCNCDIGKQGKNCEHMVWAGIKINSELKKETKQQNVSKTSDFKLELLKNINNVTEEKVEVEITPSFEIKEDTFSLSLHISQVMGVKYKVTSITKLINDLEKNMPIKYGKCLDLESYKLELQTKELLNKLDYINLKYQRSNQARLNYDEIPLIYLREILNIYLNQYLTIQDDEVYIADNINDISLYIEQKEDSVALIFNYLDKYQIIAKDIMVNTLQKRVYLLNTKSQNKIMLIDNLLEDFDGARKSTNKVVDLPPIESQDFLTNILPKIYNDFNIKLDSRLNIEVIEEKLTIKLKSYFHEKQIIIKPEFYYGQYNALDVYKDKIIKRDLDLENNLIQKLLSQGYKFDNHSHEFYIDAEKSQFIFLTQNIFKLRQEYELELDESIKKAILNFDSNSISISVNQNKNYDYFEVNYDLDQIDEKDINGIISAYEVGAEFYKMKNNSFLKLNDEKVYEQLLFVKDVIKDNTYKLNTYRVPKYKALLMGEEIRNKFSKYKFNQDFINYIESLKYIEPLNEKDFENKTYQLRPYQKEGVDWINHLYEANFGGLLADEMGLGKTLQVISFLQIQEITSGIIVLPKALLYNWKEEFAKFNPEQKVVLLEGTQSQREQILKENYKDAIVLTSYTSLIKDYAFYEDLNFEVVIIDESQYIKNPKTKTARVVKMLKGKFFLALSGTPVENNLLEYWSVFDFLIPGYLGDLKQFKKRYKFDQDEIDNLEILNKATAPFILRRLKKDVLKELPDKIESNVYCELAPEQSKIYKVMADKFTDEMKTLVRKDNFGKNSMQILAAITKLRQAAIDPGLIDSNYKEESGKVEVFKELISEVINSGQKVLVFSQFTKELKKLGEILKEEEIKYYYLDGETRPRQRLMDVEKFNKNNVPVYLISLKAGGVGLNLTGANNVIVFDPWWNPAVENQAIDRAHRIGQTDKVNVYRLISKGTIEEKVLMLKEDKQKMIDQVLNVDNRKISSFNTEELVNLLID